MNYQNKNVFYDIYSIELIVKNQNIQNGMNTF